MRCDEVRRLLALDLRSADPERIEAARAHVRECSACQARLDQFSVAVLSGYEDEIPCVECRARMDVYAAARMSRQGSGSGRPEDQPMMATHLASCPECAEDYRLLFASLAMLHEASAEPVAAAAPAVFDLSFARQGAPGTGTTDAKAAGRKELGLEAARRSRAPRGSAEGAREIGPAGWRARLAAALVGLRGMLGGAWAQQASRGALAGLAAVVLLLFTWLLVFDPKLPAPIDSLRPAKRDTATPAPADVSATQTMAVLMGIDWVDSAEGDPSDGAGTAGTPRSAATERLAPTEGSGAMTPTASARDEDRDSDRRDRDDDATQVSEPSGLRGSGPITPTLDAGAIIGYPPPIKYPYPTKRAYPGPEDPDPPIGSPTPAAAGTDAPGGPRTTPPADPPPTSAPSPGPEPTETPEAADGRSSLLDLDLEPRLGPALGSAMAVARFARLRFPAAARAIGP